MTKQMPKVKTFWAAALVLAIVLIAPSAWAGTKTVRWTHPDPASVDGFRVHLSLNGGASFDAGVVDVAKPIPSTLGVFSATVTVPDGVPVELKMSAYNTIGASTLSADSNHVYLLGAPGQPVVVTP